MCTVWVFLEQKDYCRIHSVVYKLTFIVMLSVLRGVLTALLRRVTVHNHIAETELNRTEHVLICELPVSVVQLCSGDVNRSLVTVSDVK